ncbi:S1 RNA-binding domain-containing protein [Pseudanabaena sp. FACHB-1277]|jgi:small subunit ribosomal protein S1|uniref:S1 RNA-binding domain-containing protein n=1 Tax=Pseudanabaena cinerea FACHB-1277 TaxID=2949581 RepID=A0A926USH9_9CYAN|nr:S1 RNA-binding domain-containing protein [Pseudanabaena cinerea]MBD2149971.1 S1 RNA-binding domain-containing protein [Pseudanabaena cinerea FACHB-1277]
MNPTQNIQPFSSDEFANALAEHNYEFSVGQVVKGKIISVESSGIYVDIGAKSLGFMPIDEATISGSSRATDAFPIGNEYEFLIISNQNADGEVKLSVRRLLFKQAWQTLRDYQTDSKVFETKVIGTNSGGLIVDAVGLRGFVPRSHLSNPSDLATLVGKTIPVMVLDADETRKKLVLSNRQAAKQSAMSQIAKGQLITGKVTNIRPFGAFVEFAGVSGLLHNKEISQKPVNDPTHVFQINDVIKVVVVDVDESRDRIALSTKILELHPGEMLDNSAQVFAEAEERLEKNISKLWDA